MAASHSFTDAEIAVLNELYDKNWDCQAIANVLEKPRTTVRDFGKRELQMEWDPKKRFRPDDVPTMPVEQLQTFLQPPEITITPRQTKALVNNLPFVTVVYSDIHFPFQDQKAVDVFYKVLEVLEVDEVIDLGDLVDNWQISDFLPPDERKLTPEQTSLADQFRMASEHLGTVTSLTPGAERWFLEGNHEDRWTRLLRKAQTDYKWRHVLSLPQLQQAFDANWLLGLGSAGFKPAPSKELLLHGRIVMFHGDRTTKWCTRQQLERFGKSCMFGHTHRVQNWCKRDLKATEAAWTIGCLCDLEPHYGDSQAVDWAQGFVVIVWDDEFKHYNVIQLRIHWGTCATPWGILKS